ncbi:MAG: phospholipase D-like domain-containing protein [Isosphaerales bacterium]
MASYRHGKRSRARSAAHSVVAALLTASEAEKGHRETQSVEKEQRARDSGGKLGSLHVKCVVADGRWLFLSSADLTDYAFTINMELGLLITGEIYPIASNAISTGSSI